VTVTVNDQVVGHNLAGKRTSTVTMITADSGVIRTMYPE
jgi:hypothetical protein